MFLKRRLVGSVMRLVKRLVGSGRECEKGGGSATIPLTRSSMWFNMASELSLSSPCLLDYRTGWRLVNIQHKGMHSHTHTIGPSEHQRNGTVCKGDDEGDNTRRGVRVCSKVTPPSRRETYTFIHLH